MNDYVTKKTWVEVFAYGERTAKDHATDSSYYAFRYFLNQTMNVLSKEMAKLIEKIAVRYKITVTSKIAAQIVPVIGAVTGASINAMFTDYYQDVARGALYY